MTSKYHKIYYQLIHAWKTEDEYYVDGIQYTIFSLLFYLNQIKNILYTQDWDEHDDDDIGKKY